MYSTVDISNSHIYSNAASQRGGGIYSIGQVNLDNSVVRNNKAANGGGLGNHVSSGGYSLVESEIRDNEAVNGGGGIQVAHGVAHLSIISSTVSGNKAVGSYGGGISLGGAGVTMAITDSVISYNEAGGRGGGISSSKSFTLHGGQIISNTAGDGAGLYVSGALTQTGETTVAYNQATSSNGGGLWLYSGGSASMDGIRFLNNKAPNIGGIFNEGQLEMVNSTISGNRGQFAGGISNKGDLVLTNVTLSDNGSGSHAGGILNWGGNTSLTILNSTLSGNQGAGIANKGAGTLEYVTLADNTGVALRLDDASVLTTTNSIISVGGATACSGDGSLMSGGYNLDSDDSCGLSATGDITNTNPLLNSLADNGGPTWTHAPQFDSAIIDKIPFGTNGCGTTVTTDQRGIARPQDADADGDILCDIGAYEDDSIFELSVTPAGSGNGLVTSVPAGIYCGITCSWFFDDGITVTLTAAADVGSAFTGWSGACTGLGECGVTMTETKHVTATFTLDIHLLTVALGGTGGGSVTSEPDGINCPDDCSQEYSYGTVVSLTATANTGSTFTGWSGACNETSVCQVTMNESKNVVAAFDEEEFQVYLPVVMRP